MKPETMSSKTGPYKPRYNSAADWWQAHGGDHLDGLHYVNEQYCQHACDIANRIYEDAFLAGQESSRWIPVTEENQPERNSTVIYWHKSEFGEGFPEIAHEWRWEHHGDVATHFLSAPKAPNT